MTRIPILETPDGIEHVQDTYNQHDRKVLCGIIAPSTWAPSEMEKMEPRDWFEHDPEKRCASCAQAYNTRWKRKGRHVSEETP